MAYTKKTVFRAVITEAAKIKDSPILVNLMEAKSAELVNRGVYDGNVELTFDTEADGTIIANNIRKWEDLATAEEWRAYGIEHNSAYGINWVSFEILDI